MLGEQSGLVREAVIVNSFRDTFHYTRQEQLTGANQMRKETKYSAAHLRMTSCRNTIRDGIIIMENVVSQMKKKMRVYVNCKRRINTRREILITTTTKKK